MENEVVEWSQSKVNAMLRSQYGSKMTFAQLTNWAADHGYMPYWIRRDPALKLARGVYRIPAEGDPLSTFGPKGYDPSNFPSGSVAEPVDTDDKQMQAALHDVQTRIEDLKKDASMLARVPDVLAEFVPFGDFDMILTIIRSLSFFPVFITGESGIGKTLFVEQGCALARREYIRLNVTTESDEDDFLGGMRLKDGHTYFELGPVIVAMLRGAVLLLDEIDLASAKIMCLQPVLEGKPITLKKLGITIYPSPGFTVFATANTKGRGDEQGRFIGTGLLNEAFLERFPVTVEQDFPKADVEVQILEKTFVAYGGKVTATAAVFFDTLSKWAAAIRNTYKNGGGEDIITTRRLCHIVKAYQVFGANESAQAMALSYCTNRFEKKTSESFADLYNKMAPDNSTQSNVGSSKAKKPPSFA